MYTPHFLSLLIQGITLHALDAGSDGKLNALSRHRTKNKEERENEGEGEKETSTSLAEVHVLHVCYI